MAWWLFVVATVASAVALRHCRRIVHAHYSRVATHDLRLRDATVAAKYASAAWRAVFYTTSLSAASAVAWHTGAFAASHNYCMWPDRPAPTVAHTLVYALQIAYYALDAHALAFASSLAAQNNERTLLLVHHVATVALLVVSYATRRHALGVVVVWLHDASDPLLEVAKMRNYDMHRDATAPFLAFAAVFFATRVVYYPFFVIAAIVACGAIDRLQVFALAVLACMHVYWFALIVRVVVDGLRHGGDRGNNDPREQPPTPPPPPPSPNVCSSYE